MGGGVEHFHETSSSNDLSGGGWDGALVGARCSMKIVGYHVVFVYL